MNKFTTAINTTSGSNFDNAKVMTQNINNDAPGALDFIIIMIMLGFPLASMILAFFNDIHPLFFYASFIIVLFIILMGYAYSGLWDKYKATDIGLASSMSMPMTNFIMSHFGLYSLLASFLILFGTFVKIRGQSYGGY
jgi:hypothetical protein